MGPRGGPADGPPRTSPPEGPENHREERERDDVGRDRSDVDVASQVRDAHEQQQRGEHDTSTFES